MEERLCCLASWFLTHCWDQGSACLFHQRERWASSLSLPLWPANAKENHLQMMNSVCMATRSISTMVAWKESTTPRVLRPPRPPDLRPPDDGIGTRGTQGNLDDADQDPRATIAKMQSRGESARHSVRRDQEWGVTCM